MAQKIKQGNIFGRIGSGIGQGFSEQFPKEVERKRLSEGLQQFAQKAKTEKNFSPLDQQAALYSIPGMTPEIARSVGELSRMQAQTNAYANDAGMPQQNPQTGNISGKVPIGNGSNQMPESRGFSGNGISQQGERRVDQGQNIPQQNQIEQPSGTLLPSGLSQQVQQGFIEPSQEEKQAEAVNRFRKNPAKYPGGFRDALSEVEQAVNNQRQTTQDTAALEESLTNREKKLESELDSFAKPNGQLLIPEKTYRKVRDQAIDAIRPKNKGGLGMDQRSAVTKFGKDLQEIARDYANINSISNVGKFFSSPQDTARSVNAVQKSARERGETRDFADYLVDKAGVSPEMAYSIFEPIKDDPVLKKYFSDLPKLKAGDEDRKVKTMKVARELGESLKKNDTVSPLAMARALRLKNYDDREFLRYLDNNRSELNLRDNQKEQLGKGQGGFLTDLSDLYFQFGNLFNE